MNGMPYNSKRPGQIQVKWTVAASNTIGFRIVISDVVVKNKWVKADRRSW